MGTVIKRYVLGMAVLPALLYASCGNKNSVPDTVTFTEDVAPIMYNNCSICHRDGGSGW